MISLAFCSMGILETRPPSGDKITYENPLGLNMWLATMNRPSGEKQGE